jgi:ABC-type glycerol-3-phosphate transport system permease component
MSELKNIKEYIIRNRDTYTKNAINRELRKKDYSWEAIDQVWAEVEKIEYNPNATDPWRKSKTWIIIFGFMLGVPILIGFILRFLGDSLTALAGPTVIMCVVALVIGMGVSIYTWNSDRILSRGLLTGVVLSFVLGFIPLFIIFGVCSVGRSVYSF